MAIVYGAGRAGLTDRMLGDGIAQAATLQTADSPILVSLFLQGGIDSLSLLAPAGDPLYEKLRPTLAVAPGSGVPFREDPSLTWHPSAASLANLHNAGKVLVFPGIGYSRRGHVALHLAPLLGGRRHRRRRSTPAGWAATSTSPAMRRTRSRDCRWTAR